MRYAVGFVGAWIELKDQPLNAETEAYVGMAGPLAALLCYWLARSEGSRLLLAVMAYDVHEMLQPS